MGLPMVVMLGKATKISLGRNSCNILARESLREEQLKKSLKSSSPHQKAQEKVCPPIAMKIQCWI
jgi:hypothetical protein